jgi:signal transduction histidine kinase
VKDYGIGIAEEDSARIFQRFERAISANEVSGMGLGLYFVKQVVDLHGGSISLRSEIGKGSEFVVYLPLMEKEKAWAIGKS